MAYVYPGWHDAPSRPGIDEWQLLSRFEPYYEGHTPHPVPLHGRYDDTQPATARAQMSLAARYGIRGFTYFAYFGHRGFALAEPVDAAFAQAASVPGFALALTLCLRLPHPKLPITLTDRHWRRYSPLKADPLEPAPAEPALADEPHDRDERTTVADLKRVLGAEFLAEQPVVGFWRTFLHRSTTR